MSEIEKSNILITEEKMLAMLSLQSEMNAIVNPNWPSAGYNWSRAILVEAVEAMDHHGWKWWKKQECDIAQLRVELVDIWHFMLSYFSEEVLLPLGEYDDQRRDNALQDLSRSLSSFINNEKHHSFDIQLDGVTYGREVTLLESLQLMAGLAAAFNATTVGGSGYNRLLMVFSLALEKSGMTWNDLFTDYIGKNCLNRFRQANGYKAGTYIKNWSLCPLTRPIEVFRALEDNDHLCDLMSSFSGAEPDLFVRLTAGLQARYETVLNGRN